MISASRKFKDMGEAMSKHAQASFDELNKGPGEGSNELAHAMRCLSAQILSLDAGSLLGRAEAVHNTAELCSRIESIGEIMRSVLEGAAKRIIVPSQVQ